MNILRSVKILRFPPSDHVLSNKRGVLCMMTSEKYARQSLLRTLFSSTTSGYITSSNLHMCNQRFTPIHTEYGQPAAI